jgi:putative membrane protein
MQEADVSSKKSDEIHVAGALAFILVFGGILSFGRHIVASSRPVEDSDFAIRAAQGRLAEVKMGQLAQGKGTNPAVKTFGNRLVADHTKAGEELEQIASRQGIKLPNDLSAPDQEMYIKLLKLDGDAFDKEYAQLMVKDHRDDVKEFQEEAKTGKNQYLKDFAGQTLPTLQEHLKQAQELALTVGADAAM